MRQKSAGVFLASVLSAMVFASLYPFDFAFKNNVVWVEGGKGLRFARPGVAYIWLRPGETSRVFMPWNPVTIEFRIVPGDEPETAPSLIFTVCDHEGREAFALGQWKSDLVVYSSHPPVSLQEGYSKAVAPGILKINVPTYVAVVFRGEDTFVYADGRTARESKGFALSRRGDIAPDLVVIGNSFDGKKSWTGDLLFLAIHDRALTPREISGRNAGWMDGGIPGPGSGDIPLISHEFAQGNGTFVRGDPGGSSRLEIPRGFRPWKENLLEFPETRVLLSRSSLLDSLLNVLGFIPFGTLATALFRKKKVGGETYCMVLVILAGGGFSLGIELLQFFLPGRSSSLVDVIMNTIGTMFGVGLYGVLTKEWKRR